MRVAVALMLVALASGGCLSADPSSGPDLPSAGDLPQPANVLPWGLAECRYVVAFGYVDGQRLVPYLPEGFTPRPSRLLGAAGDTWFGFDVMTCASGMGLNTSVAPMHYGYLWAAADPPSEYLQDGIAASEHYAKWDVFVPDAARRAVLDERGVPVFDGSAQITASGSSVDAVLTLDGVGDHGIQGLVTGQAGPFDGGFVKISAADGGAAAWRTNATSGQRQTGNAVLSFPEGSWATDVVGGTELMGQFHTGTWSYSGSEIRFLEAPVTQ